MSEDLWVVRAGREARYADEFVAGSYVAISFDEFAPDDLAATDEEALKIRAGSPAERAYAGQLIAFAYRMQPGDLVIVPRLPRHRDYLVGRVTGPYLHVPAMPESGPHRRAVQWLGGFSRDALTTSATNTLGAILTLFKPAAVEAELRDLLTALAPVNSAPPAGNSSTRTPAAEPAEATLPIAVVPARRPLPETQLDIEVDPQGRARITCAHPALVMEQTPRHLDPRSGWGGSPGIYVLTGTDLQQSVSRTGNEQTLTTTLIVRPWAYVGLSEDFHGRINSHRQSKKEWRRALFVRSGGRPFSSDDIKYLEHKVHTVLEETGEVLLTQQTPRGNLSAQPRNPAALDACADTVVAVLRLTGTLI